MQIIYSCVFLNTNQGRLCCFKGSTHLIINVSESPQVQHLAETAQHSTCLRWESGEGKDAFMYGIDQELCGGRGMMVEDCSPPTITMEGPSQEAARQLADNDKTSGLSIRQEYIMWTGCGPSARVHRPIRESALRHISEIRSERINETRWTRCQQANCVWVGGPSPHLHRRCRLGERCLSTLWRASAPVMSHFHKLFIDQSQGVVPPCSLMVPRTCMEIIILGTNSVQQCSCCSVG